MRKYALIILIAMAMSSCTSSVILESTTDGKTIRLYDLHSISKTGDTLVVATSPYGSVVYGKYKGVLPLKGTTRGEITTYETYKRLR
jgi:hypothetical protein